MNWGSKHHVRRGLLLGWCAGLVLGLPAYATERESTTISAIDSNGDETTGTIRAVSFAGQYPVRRIRMTGTLIQVNAQSYEDEAVIEVQPPGSNDWFQMFWEASQQFPAAVNASAYLDFLPEDVFSAAGTWKFRFSESEDDPGVDARWLSVTLTTDDGITTPPPAIDLGVLGPGGVFRTDPLAPYGVNWFRLSLNRAASWAEFTSLEIATAGSVLDYDPGFFEVPDDTLLAVYDANGILVASNDDAPSWGYGQYDWSVLNFGIYGSMELPAGTYYIAASATGDAFAGNFSVEPYTAQSGTTRLTVIGNAYECTPPVIVESPVHQAVNPGSSVVMSSLATDSVALTYQWYRNGYILNDQPGRISGAQSPTLTITDALAGDSGEYSIVITGTCSVSASANLTVRCLGDIDRDGDSDLFDFFDFFNSFSAQDMRADIDLSGAVDLADFFAFFNGYDDPDCSACPAIPTMSSPNVTGPNSATISWQSDPFNVLEYVIDAAFNGGTYVEIARVPFGVGTYTLTNLVPGGLYCVRVRSGGAGCSSDPSVPVCFTTPVPPVAPTELSVSNVWDTTLDLRWRDNSTNEVRFDIERLLENSWVPVAMSNPNTTSMRLTGLVPSTNYVLRVRAINGAGGSASRTVLVRTGPARPLNIRVTDISDTSAIARWDDVSTDESGFEIWLDRWNGTTWERAQNLESPAQDTGRRLSPPDLARGQLYRVTVRAERSDGTRSGISSWAEFTTDTGLPAVPNNLRVDNLWFDKVDLRWNDNSTNESEFYMAISTDGANWNNVAIVPGGPGPEKVVRVDGLQHLTRYFFKVRAKNAIGFSEYSNVLTVDTPNRIPVAPCCLIAVNRFRQAIDLRWTDLANNEIGYRIAISTNGTTWNNIGGDLPALPGVGGDYTRRVSGLQPNTNYWFQVRCFNELGNSEYSNIIGPIRTLP